MFSQAIPLSLYIHFPWCVRKCPYCDFNSHEAKTSLDQKAYVAALLADLEQELPDVWGRKIVSIFMGGGTPSLFDPESLDQLLSGIRARLQLVGDCEITLEANPGTFEQEKFAEYRALGINRLSIGVQSFNDDHLQKLGRIHDRKQAIRAIEKVHDAGFDNFNLDLMYGLPGQTLQQAMQDVQTAMALEPTHLSHYQLTIEPNTLFYRQPPTLPEDDDIVDMLLDCQRVLQEKGYAHYEVSAYARDKHQCRHNLNYWQFGDYLGIGAGAHGKITFPAEEKILRRWKVKHPQTYLQQASCTQRISGEQVLSNNDIVFEFMMNALRLVDGFDVNQFNDHTGLALNDYQHLLEQAFAQGWLEQTGNQLHASTHGMQYLNELLQLFLGDEHE